MHGRRKAAGNPPSSPLPLRQEALCIDRGVQAVLDEWISGYNESRPHQERWCFSKTPMQAVLDAIPIAKEKMIAARMTADKQNRPAEKAPSVRSSISY
jgi:hypothetical protein